MAEEEITRLLKDDHDAVRKMLKELQDANGRKAKDLLARITQALRIHTRVEEEIVYPEYRKCLGDDEANVLVQESLTEHNIVDRVLEEIHGLRASTYEFQGKAKVLYEMVDHHAGDEEEEMFPRLRKACSLEDRKDLGRRVAERKQELEEGLRDRKRRKTGDWSQMERELRSK